MRNLVERELTSAGPRRTGGAASGRRSVTVNLAESPLTWLHSRGHLTDRQFDAGERLRTDYASMAPWPKQARACAISCGASSVPGKVCLLRKRRWHCRCEAGNWYCRWRSIGSHNSTGSPDRQDSVNLSTSRL